MQLHEQENTLEEHFPKSLHCFYVLLRTTLPYHLILTVYLRGFGWIHNVTDLVSAGIMSDNGPNEEGEEPRLGGVICVDSERMSSRRGSSQSCFSWHHQLCELRLQMSLSDSLSNHWCRMKKWITPPFCLQPWIAKGWNDGAVSHLFTHFVLSVVVHYSHILEGSLVLTAVLPWRFQIKQGLHSQQNSLKFSDRFCTGFGGNKDKISESGWGIRDGFSWMSR